MSFFAKENRFVSFQDLWSRGYDTSGLVPSGLPDVALQLVAVQACIRLIAESVSSLPIHPYRDRGGVPVKDTTQYPILTKPHPVLSRKEWLYQWLASELTDGNAFGLVLKRDAQGRPQQLEWLPPRGVSVSGSTIAPTYSYNGQTFSLTNGEITHERAMIFPGELRGLSPLRAAKRAVDLGIDAEKFGAQFFSDGAHPSSVLYSDQKIDKEQAELVKARFIAAIRGNREPAVLGAGLRYEAIQISPDESQFLQTQKFSIAQIARLYGIPPEMIGGESGNSMTYANVEQRSIDFVTFVLMPWITRLEAALTSWLPSPVYVKFNVDAMIRSDLLSRYQAHAIAIDHRFESPNEVRAYEDKEPYDGGDTFTPITTPAKAAAV